MELASRPARRYIAAFRLAAKASCDAEVVRRPLVACHRIYGLRVDGLGHLGLAGASARADADAELGMGVTALGAQPDRADYYCPRFASVALRVDKTG